MLERYNEPLIPYQNFPLRYIQVIIPYYPRGYFEGNGEAIMGYILDNDVVNTRCTNYTQLNNKTIKIVLWGSSNLIEELGFLNIVPCEFRENKAILDINWAKNKFPTIFADDWKIIKDKYNQFYGIC